MMKVIVSAAISIDGFLDDCLSERLILSSAEDWTKIYCLRAECDAIMVGANTLRRDNPSLLIKDVNFRSEREARGQSADIAKVTMSRSGDLSADLRFFEAGVGDKIVFVPQTLDNKSLDSLKAVADVVSLIDVTAVTMVDYLASKGFKSLMVEGGSDTLTMFFEQDMVDELRLAIAPFFVGDKYAPRFVNDGVFPYNQNNKMILEGVEMLGDVSVIRYLTPRGRDRQLLEQAIDLSRQCKPSDSAYCVGAVVVTCGGGVYTGYTHEVELRDHAEEVAIDKALAAGEALTGASIYSSLEPCSARSSKLKSCSALIIEHGFSKVVFALYEPSCFVECKGAQILADAGVEVKVYPEFGHIVEQINAHIIL